MTQRGRGDWKCVSVRGGALSMEMDGLLSTLKLPADNWDMRLVVSSLHFVPVIATPTFYHYHNFMHTQ